MRIAEEIESRKQVLAKIKQGISEQRKQLEQDHPVEWYIEENTKLEKLSGLLDEFRLQGGLFPIYKFKFNGPPLLMEIKSDGVVIVSQFLKDWRIPSFSSLKSLESLNRYNRKELLYCHISDLRKVILPPSVNAGNNGCTPLRFILVWTFGKCEYFSKEAEEIVQVLGVQLKQYNRRKLLNIQFLRQIFQDLVPFDYNLHSNLLAEFAELVFKRPVDLKNDSKWNEVGFQSNCPASDFRGMGLFGLKQLIYLAKHRQRFVQEVIRDDREYPLAATCLNISNYIINLLKLTKSLMALSNTDPRWDSPFLILLNSLPDPFQIEYEDSTRIVKIQDAINEFFCFVVEYVDYIYTSRGSKYMDFPEIFGEVKAEVHFYNISWLTG